MDFHASFFDRKEEQEYSNWGIETARKEEKEAPDLNCDKTDIRKEPPVNILKRDEEEVVEKVIRIANSESLS